MKLACSSSPHWGSLQCCARLCGIEWPRSTEPLSLLACPPAVVLATCHRDIQRCLPSSRHIDSPFHFFDTITAPGRANLRSSHQPDQRPFLFFFLWSNATDSARVRASSMRRLLASLACTACNCLMTSIHVYTFYHLPQHLILTYCNQYHTQFVSSGTTTTTKKALML